MRSAATIHKNESGIIYEYNEYAIDEETGIIDANYKHGKSFKFSADGEIKYAAYHVHDKYQGLTFQFKTTKTTNFLEEINSYENNSRNAAILLFDENYIKEYSMNGITTYYNVKGTISTKEINDEQYRHEYNFNNGKPISHICFNKVTKLYWKILWDLSGKVSNIVCNGYNNSLRGINIVYNRQTLKYDCDFYNDGINITGMISTMCDDIYDIKPHEEVMINLALDNKLIGCCIPEEFRYEYNKYVLNKD